MSSWTAILWKWMNEFCQNHKAKTNAESIRALSDEDLANFLIGFSWLAENGVKMCYKTITKWLQQPAKED